jgi:thiamine-phosphate pyrophosphorylase
MCLTQDGLALSHVAQAERLCAGGAHWVQLRMKGAGRDEWLSAARAVVAVCRGHGVRCIINDSVEIALAADADGVHLGKTDGDWRAARQRLGPDRLLGGTVNNPVDAARAIESKVLDYVGVGPLRFTSTKKALAPVLGVSGVAALLEQLGQLPAWVIGGVLPADLPELKAAGAAGVAVSGGVLRDGEIEARTRLFLQAWSQPETTSLAT